MSVADYGDGADYFLNSEWMRLWFDYLRLNDGYRSYVSGMNEGNKDECTRLEAEHDGIEDVYDLWGDVFFVDDLEPDEREEDDLYLEWFIDHGHKQYIPQILKTDIIRTGNLVDPGTLAFTYYMALTDEQKAIIEEQLVKPVEKINKQLIATCLSKLRPKIAKVISGFMEADEHDVDTFNVAKRRLNTYLTVEKHRAKDPKEFLLPAMFELLADPIDEVWEDRLKKVEQNASDYDFSHYTDMGWDDLREEYQTFYKEYEAAQGVIHNAATPKFPTAG